MRKEITIKSIAALEKDGGRITDNKVGGFVARCLPSGRIQFGYQYGSRQARRWISIGLLGEVSVAEARRRAEKYAGQVADHRDPAAEFKTKTARSENTVNAVLDKWVEAHVAKLRTAKPVTAALANHVRPAIGDKVIYDLKRADIINLKEKIAKQAGGRAAELQIGYLRSAFVWWQKRDEEFNSPVVEGMNETQRKARSRILTSEEIVDLGHALDEYDDAPDCFPAYVKVLFLTACRRSEVSEMHTRELECGNQHAMMGGVGTKKATSWTIPAHRYKTKVDMTVPLIPAIKKLLPECEDGFVFASGKKPIRDFNHPKAKLDAKIAEIRKREKRPPMPRWTFHDLRRTARTIMAAAGVQRDIAERVLGHVIPGVEGVYNRWEYHTEKAAALGRLAAHVDGIVHPKQNVVPMRAKRAKRAAASPA
jgi:integrase